MREREAGDSRTERRYELVGDPPPPWSWDVYEGWLTQEWANLLEGADARNEQMFQKFLEQHPCLVPGGEGTGESFGGHHGSWGDLLITQPRLPGIIQRYPDFMWLTKNSEDIIPVLVELEAPAKKWLTNRGDRTAELTHAEGQLAEWKAMLDNPTDRQLFADLYAFPLHWATEHNLVPRFMLIYGRRSEFARDPTRQRRRRVLRDMAVDAMTYDRLRPLAGSRNALCVRMTGVRPRVVSVPPTFRVGPNNAKQLAKLNGVTDAVRVNELISDERKSFLLDRIPYWRDLGEQSVKGKGLGLHKSSDWE